MRVEKVMAALPVSDFKAAAGWYERLFGRTADERPMDGLAEWHFGDGVVQVVLDEQRAGSALPTLGVDDLDGLLKRLADGGLEPSGVTEEVVSRIASTDDPAGNAITFAEVHPERG